ncbi:MAG: PAS domain S-box protein [Sedimentisphaerales bacterium]|nr:PAS domain S-box protein [Sedimentisphaerales bacterium]
MKKETIPNDDFLNLRRKVEHDLRNEKFSIEKMSEEDILKTIHELRVHQIELEMQNEELRKAQIELEESRSKYTELFDFAPVGYFVLDKKGVITEANLTGAVMMGIERNLLLEKPFVLCIDNKEDKDTFYLKCREVFQTGTHRRFDLMMNSRERGQYPAELLIEPMIDVDKQITRCRIAVIDISARQYAERQVIELAKFPAENPFPVLRISEDGTIVYSNKPGEVFLDELKCKIGQKVPSNWIRSIKNSMRYNRQFTEQIKCGQNIFSIAIASIPDAGYVNLYGRDITIQEQIKDELRKARDELDLKVHQRTTELAQTISILQKEIKDRIAAQAQLRERIKVLDAFFAYTITPLVILDRDFNFIRVNKAYADSCQKNINEFEGHNHFEFYPNEENEGIFKQVVMTKKPYQALARPFSFPDHPEAGVTYWNWTLVPILDNDGQVEFLVFSLMDVTKRKMTELALMESEENYRSLVEFSPESVCVIAEEKIVFVNASAMKLLKANNPEEVIGKSLLEFIHPDFVNSFREDMKLLLEKNKRIRPREIKFVFPDGSLEEIETSATSVIHQGKQGILIMLHDITERKKAEDEIRRNHQELRALSARLQLAEEQERRKIAQDLHDSIGQILAFSGRELKKLQKSVPEDAAKTIKEIAQQLDLAITQTRTLSFDLSPGILYDLGFEVAVEDLVDKISKERKIQCLFKDCEKPKPLTDEVKVLLYRSIRELLINAIKHSRATIVKVSLLRLKSNIHIMVEDDGKGFDVSIQNDISTKRKGFGIFSIRERLNHIGGKLEIESAKGRGTKAVLIAPLDIKHEKQ